MNTSDIKNHLHELVVETNDLNILAKIEAYFKQLKSEKVDWWSELNTNQKDEIELGITQLNEGQGIAHKNVRANIDNLLQNNG
jgi:hypothetical protein